MASVSSADLAYATVGTVGEARNAIGNALIVVGRAYNLSGLTAFDRAQLDSARVSLEQWYAPLKGLAANISWREQFESGQWRITLAMKLVKGIADVVRLRDQASWASFVSGLPEGFAEALGYVTKSTLNAVGGGVGAIGGGLVSGLGIAGTLVVALVIYLVYFKKGIA